MKKNKIAEESTKTRRAREKLRKHLQEVEKKITPEALEHKISEIQNWIARHSKQRIALKEKDFSLFDENRNIAKSSKNVDRLSRKLKEKLKL